MISRFAPPVKKPSTRGNLRGVTSMRRFVGHSKGKNVVAIGVSSTNRQDAGQVDSPYYLIGLALVKYVLKREFGVHVVNVATTIYNLVPPVYHTQNNVVKDIPRFSQFLTYFRKTNDSNSAVVPVGNHPITNTTTVGSLAIDVGNVFRDFCSIRYSHPLGSTDTISFRTGHVFYGYSVGVIESMGDTQGAATVRSLTGVRRCEDMIMSMNVKTTIRIQNTTQGLSRNPAGDAFAHSGSDSLIEEPLKGRMYHFSDPVAIVRHDVTNANVVANGHYLTGNPMDSYGSVHHWIGHDVNEDGIVKTTQVNNDAYVMRHMPLPELWQNCKGYSNFIIRPGEVKYHKQMFKFDGYINKLLEAFAIDQDPNITRNIDNLGAGVLDLFCFEEAMKSDMSDVEPTYQPILDIGYEITRVSECHVKKNIKRGTLMVRDYNIPTSIVTTDTNLVQTL